MKRFVLCSVFVVLAALGGGCADEKSSPTVIEEEDLPEEVSVVVGKQGGIVRAKGMTLDVPEGALSKDVTITAKVTGKATPKDVKVVSRVYEFGPKGTSFMKDVSLSFQMEKPEPQAKVYFTKAESETEFEKLATSTKDKEVSAKIRHFSLGFAGIAEDEASPVPDPDASVEDDGGVGPDGGESSVSESPITVHSLDGYGRGTNQTWAAYRDGTDSWQLLPTPTTPGSYVFNVKQAEYAVAFVCSDSENADSVGTVVYARSTRQTLEVEATGGCSSAPPAMLEISGTLSNLPSGASEFRSGHAFFSGWGDVVSAPLYRIPAIPMGTRVTPWLGIVDANSLLLQVHRLGDYNLAANLTLDIDLSVGAQSLGTMASFRVLKANTSVQMQVDLTTDYHKSGLALAWSVPYSAGATEWGLSYTPLVDPITAPNEQYRFYAAEDLGETLREAELFRQAGGDVALDLPAALSVTLGYEPATAFLPTAAFEDGAGATGHTLGYAFEGGNGARRFTLHAENGLTLLTGLPGELVFPDLTLAPGFEPEWAAALVATVDVFAGVLQESSTAGALLRTRSERREPMHLTH